MWRYDFGALRDESMQFLGKEGESVFDTLTC